LYSSDRNDKAAARKLAALHRSLYQIIDLAEDVPQRQYERVRMDYETLRFTVQSLQSDIQELKSPVVDRLYLRLSNLVNVIDHHIEEGNLALARQKILMANRLVLNIYRLISSQPTNSSDELKMQMDRAKQDYAELQNRITDASFPPELVEVIKNNLDHAEKAYQEGNQLVASYYLKMVNRLILKLNRMRLMESVGEPESKSVESDLQRLEDLINRIDLNGTPERDYAIRYENSKELYRIAQKAFMENDLKLCEELVTMGINLITQ
jgi:hypothetical protein